MIAMKWEGWSGRWMVVEGRREFVVRRAFWSMDGGLLDLDDAYSLMIVVVSVLVS